MRLAVIADIHGNVLALEAVLADIARRHANLTINLGDCVSGPLWPTETFELLHRLRLPTVRGNHDRALVSPAADLGKSDAYAVAALSQAANLPGFNWETEARAELAPAACQVLASLPATLRPQPGILACHGTPDSDTSYLLETVHHGGLALADAETIAGRLDATAESLVLCAHSHLPRIACPGARLIVNPGSVGCPAYIDDGNPRHISETGSPHARYAVLDDAAGSWAVDLIAVTYDWTRAAARARQRAAGMGHGADDRTRQVRRRLP